MRGTGCRSFGYLQAAAQLELTDQMPLAAWLAGPFSPVPRDQAGRSVVKVQAYLTQDRGRAAPACHVDDQSEVVPLQRTRFVSL
jgi:hypothetical protein